MKKIALLLAVVFALTALFGPGLSEVTASPGLTVNSNADTDKAADTYDVIVIGGEPEGIAAAVSAARNGQRTLLVEHGDALGGLMTLGDSIFSI